MDTIRRGNVAEAGVLKALVGADLHVLVPFGGGCPFDLAVATADGQVLRLQVKSGRVREGCIRFNTCSTDHGRGRLDYRDRADLIAVYVEALDRVFIVPVEDCPSFAGVLRMTAPRNNQRRGVRFAEEHSFEAWAASLK